MSVVRLLTHFLALTVVAALVGGCQTTGTDKLVASSAPPEISGPAASAIAGDMVSRLAEHVGPGTGTILLKPDGSPFGGALEASLKAWGYAVVSDQKTDGEKLIPLAYVIDSYDGQVLARLSTGSLDLGRAYTATSASATPASPLSVMRRG
ncbi:conjugal transfer protein TrbH [Mesorhizobium sp.]|uniref:conjugal transfer protein TrbH n=3 Tax=unclassified Mesorhizobium TaxID=325217 RepID=UPI000FE95482|nr:conjugal transfer protein TrbH [Mesorhizobium sp.]RWF83205.1 MAG: conjugal transfer protein TrbH [Mesorhizobium sp.]RWG04530.1 MAG: conjugal transfer protein TrbH [Mesorhizobium sp.]RWG90601.1 MAG: conjugal transfer protein TrbH [Mesorhizobium sp.]RWH07471.1 MAG: conjugal transfer protein TrbH [Mesorhizobium sp.]RWH08484.1 MAG: conjugal transfer protein TrbH [Mesorhizobium sp.]